jgi:hypothetical protein
VNLNPEPTMHYVKNPTKHAHKCRISKRFVGIG